MALIRRISSKSFQKHDLVNLESRKNTEPLRVCQAGEPPLLDGVAKENGGHPQKSLRTPTKGGE
jgi:hypothetical protein